MLKKNTTILAFSLLSISFFLVTYGAIGPGIPLIQEAFPSQPLTSIELLTTLPSAAITIFVLLSGVIEKKLGSKNLVILGLGLATLSGVIPFFIHNFTMIIISRITLGIGIGLYNSLAVSLISVYFDGDQKARLIGYQTAVQGLGAATVTFLTGKLLTLGWQYMFMVYFIGIIPLTLFILFVPKVSTNEAEKKQEMATIVETKKDWSGLVEVLIIAFLTALVAGLFMSITVKLSGFLIDNNIGNSANAASILSLFSMAMMASGFIFSSIFKKLRYQTASLGLLILGFGFIGLSLSQNLYLIGVIVVFCGLAGGLSVPTFFSRVTSHTTGPMTTYVSIVIVGSNFGVTLSPYMFKALESMFQLHNTGALFGVIGGIYIVISCLIFCAVKFYLEEDA